MIKNVLKVTVLFSIFAISCSQEENLKSEELIVISNQKDPLTAQQVNSEIDEAIATKGSFSWKNASNHLLWSASFRGPFAFSAIGKRLLKKARFSFSCPFGIGWAYAAHVR